jgi:DNA-3-methyladenine glycosylase
MTRPATTRATHQILDQPTLDVASALLGWHLVRDDATGRRVARIVELEAYIGEEDRASHARFGRTGRNEAMYGPPGRAYVYLVYGMHDCLNIVTEPAGVPAALLVRAVEPLEGIERMRAARELRARTRRRAAGPAGPATNEPRRGASRVPDDRLAAGPGLVCATFDLDRTLTGHDLFDETAQIRIVAPPPGDAAPAIVATPRIGIGYAGEPWTDVPWRLSIASNASVSRPRPAAAD